MDGLQITLPSLTCSFLDIEMTAIDGMEAARRIREQNQTIQLVFVTGYADYVFDGYSVGALDYLMKPVQPERFDRFLYGLLLRCTAQPIPFISVTTPTAFTAFRGRRSYTFHLIGV